MKKPSAKETVEAVRWCEEHYATVEFHHGDLFARTRYFKKSWVRVAIADHNPFTGRSLVTAVRKLKRAIIWDLLHRERRVRESLP